MRLACCLPGWDLSRVVDRQPRSSQCEHLALKQRPHCTCCGKPRTQRLRGTTVLVQDGTGMDICNANCTCAKMLPR